MEQCFTKKEKGVVSRSCNHQLQITNEFSLADILAGITSHLRFGIATKDLQGDHQLLLLAKEFLDDETAIQAIDAYLSLIEGHLALREGDFEGAIEFFQQANEQHPDGQLAEALRGQAAAFAQQGQYEEALPLLEQVIERDPHSLAALEALITFASRHNNSSIVDNPILFTQLKVHLERAKGVVNAIESRGERVPGGRAYISVILGF